MPRYPEGIGYKVTTKLAVANIEVVVGEFIPDRSIPYEDGVARTDAQALFDATHAGHVGATREYRFLQCIEMAYEERPIV